MAYISTLYGAKYLKSSTYAVISRTKVYLQLLFNSLFAKDDVNVNLLIFSLVSFVGVTLVVDSTIFGLGSADEPEIPNNEAGIAYLRTEMLGIMFCFAYVFFIAFSKVLETYYGSPPFP